MWQGRDGLDRLAVLVLVAATTCAPAVTAPVSASSNPTSSLTPRTEAPTPTRSAAAPPTIQPPTGVTPKPGGCTTAQTSTRGLLDKYFSLTTSNDVGAVLDCFAKPYREHVDMESSARRWANAGTVLDLRIDFLDRVNACDRYRASWDFAIEDPFHPNPWLIFYSVGLELGAPRIFDAGTGLTAPDYTTVTCG